MARKILSQFPALLMKLIVVQLVTSTAAQLQIQPQVQPSALQSQVQPPPPAQSQVQPQQVVKQPVQLQAPSLAAASLAQPQAPQQAQLQAQPAARANMTIPAKPPVKQQVTKLEIKPVIRIEAPLKALVANKTLPSPKKSMKIMKVADRSSDDDSNASKGFFSSLVDVDRSRNKTKVGVHIPLIFDMTNDKDFESGKSKLDLTVLSGLVSVNRQDRENGSKGPVTVTVFGIPVYTGTGNGGVRDFSSRLQSTLSEQRKRFDDSIENVTGSRQLPDATMQLYSQVKRTGEKGLSTITDSLDKVSSFLKDQAAPITNANGRPAAKSDSFIAKTINFKPEDLKPRVSETEFKKFATTNTTGHNFHLQIL